MVSGVTISGGAKSTGVRNQRGYEINGGTKSTGVRNQRGYEISGGTKSTGVRNQRGTKSAGVRNQRDAKLSVAQNYRWYEIRGGAINGIFGIFSSAWIRRLYRLHVARKRTQSKTRVHFEPFVFAASCAPDRNAKSRTSKCSRPT